MDSQFVESQSALNDCCGSKTGLGSQLVNIDDHGNKTTVRGTGGRPPVSNQLPGPGQRPKLLPPPGGNKNGGGASTTQNEKDEEAQKYVNPNIPLYVKIGAIGVGALLITQWPFGSKK